VYKASTLEVVYIKSTVQGFRLLNLLLYPIVVLAGTIEFMWRGLETGER